jgi:hypothetical protein
MPKILLPKPSPNVHLSKSGYRLDKTELSRHKSLKKASKKQGTLEVLKRLNLIRNLTKKDTLNKKKLSKDVDYMKKLYKTEKKTTNKKYKKTTKK